MRFSPVPADMSSKTSREWSWRAPSKMWALDGRCWTIAAAALMAKLRGAAEKQDPLSGLTDQERTLLGLLSEGLTNKQIADRMFLAEKTVKNYVSRLLAKLGMERRTQAAVFATELKRSRPPGDGP